LLIDICFNYSPDTHCMFVFVYLYYIITFLFLLFCRFCFIAHINSSPSYYRRRCSESHNIMYFNPLPHGRLSVSFRSEADGHHVVLLYDPTDLERYLLSPVLVSGAFFQLYLSPPGGVKVLGSIIIDYFMSGTNVSGHRDYIVREI